MRIVLLAVIGFLSISAYAQVEPVRVPERLLEIDGYTVDQYRAGATPAQDAQPLLNQRGTGLDGSLRLQAPFGWVVNANPFHEEWNDKAWYLGEIMLNTGRYSPTEIDMALPAPGFRWTVGRTYNIPGDPNNGSQRTEGYQGYNWQQFSQPELVYVGGSSDVDYIYIVYGADRYLTFRQLEENSPVFRGVNGAAGAVVAGASGDHELFVYWDQHGTRSTFFDPRDGDNEVTVSPAVHNGQGQLWTIEDAAGNKAYVGHPTDPADAIEAGYNGLGYMQVAFDTAGRKYVYGYSQIVEDSPGTGSELRLTSVEAFEPDGMGDWDTTGAKVEYTYARSLQSGRYSFGDLIDVAMTTPLSGFSTSPSDSVSTRHRQYLYHLEANNKNWIRYAFSPEGSRQYEAIHAYLPAFHASPTDDGLFRHTDFRFEYRDAGSMTYAGLAGRISAIERPGAIMASPSDRILVDYGDYSTFQSSVSPAYDVGHATYTAVVPTSPLAKVVFLQYFDEAGQPVTHAINPSFSTPGGLAHSPLQAEMWTYVSRNSAEGVDGVDGMISMIARPMSIESSDFDPSGVSYTRPCEIKGASVGEDEKSYSDGRLVYVFPRETSTSSSFWGFLIARSWQNGENPPNDEDGPFPFEEYDYLTPVEDDVAAATVGGEYLVIRPLMHKIRLVPSINFSVGTYTTEETVFSYEFHAEPIGTGSTSADDPAWLTPRWITSTLPKVPTSQLGANTDATRQDFFRPDGTLVYSKDEVGSFAYIRQQNDLMVRYIEDADLGETSDFASGEQPADYMASVPSTTGALHQVTDLVRDEMGRPTQATLPTGRIRQAHYTALSSGELVEVWSARSVGGTHDGPAEYLGWNLNGNLIVDAAIAFPSSGSTSAGIDTWVDPDANHPLHALDVGELSRIQTYVLNGAGRLHWTERNYVRTPSIGDGARGLDYDEQFYEYGAEQRPTGWISPNGTTRELEFDVYGNAVITYVGNLNPSAASTTIELGEPVNEPGGKIKPDGSTDACCQLYFALTGIWFTQQCGPPSGPMLLGTGGSGLYYMQASLREKPAFAFNPEAPHVFREYDNLGRLIREAQYAAIPSTTEGPGFTLRSTLPDPDDAADPDIFNSDFDDRFDTPRTVTEQRLSLVEYEYNTRGRITRVRRYDIDQSSGEIETDGSGEKYIETVFAYDDANRLIYHNDDRVTKIRRDRLGREVTRYEIANNNDLLTNYSSLTNPNGDLVVRQTQRLYEADSGNLTHEVLVDRITNIDPMDPEPFGSIDENDYSDTASFVVDPAEIFGRAQITEYVYDDLDRVIERRMHGTGNTESGSTFNPASPPSGALAVTLTRDPAGRVVEMEDELGRVQKRSYDLAGKVTSTIDNFDSPGTAGTATDDINRLTRYEYLHTQLVSYKAYTNPANLTQYQETQYQWYADGTTDSEDTSRDRLHHITYPDTKSESYNYTVRGSLIGYTDRHENLIEIDLDHSLRAALVRFTHMDTGSDFLQNSDDAIEISYTPRGSIESIAQTRDSGAWIHDEVEFEYDGYGALTSISHSQPWMAKPVMNGGLGLATVGPAKHSFGYSWARSAAAAPSHLRLATNTYPDTKVLAYNYTGTTNNAFSRVASMSLDSTTVATYEYLGVDRPALTTYPENSVFSTLRNHTTGAYDALDRFNRPVRSRWNRTRASNQVPFYDTTVFWDAGSNVTGVTDHVFDTDFNFVYANDHLDRLVGSTRGGGTGEAITSLIEQEDWSLTKVGNWDEHDLELTGDSPGNHSDPGEFRASGAFSDINETTLIERDLDGNGTDPPVEFVRVYDSNGNLISDPEKNHTYKWDVLGRLMEIRGVSNALVAEFRYNALGYRIAERIAAEGEDWTRLVYDARWRIVATYKIDVSEDEEALHERFVYHAAGLDGLGGGSYIDALVLRDRDADGNGSLEERHYYAQSWRHDVVAVIDHQGRQIEHVRYTPYGVPISIPMSDKDRNGELEQADVDAMVAAITAYTDPSGSVYQVEFDNDLDGDIDFTDLSLTISQINAIGTDPIGRGVLSSYGHRAGYAGYQWIPAAGLYHVRYRWYDPLNGTWISKDPAGYVDGSSLFSYLASTPLVELDPYGLGPLDWFRDGTQKFITNFNDTNQYIVDEFHQFNREDRDAANEDHARTKEEAKRSGYNDDLPKKEVFHTVGAPGNDKWSHPETGHEVVFDENDDVVTDPRNRGTFNYVPANGFISGCGHTYADILPWIIDGTGEDDPSRFVDRLELVIDGLLDLITPSTPPSIVPNPSPLFPGDLKIWPPSIHGIPGHQLPAHM